jgi:quercetin dioxygenase-like cupin family protein
VVIVSRRDPAFEQLPGRESANPFERLPNMEFSLRKVRIEGSRSRFAHRHPHSREAVFVVSGSGTLWEAGDSHRIEAGDFVLIEAGVPHATLPDPDSEMELLCFFPHPELSNNIEETDDLVVEPGGRR